MRHIAVTGIMLLVLAGCQSLPALVRIEVDGSTLSFEKDPAKAPASPSPVEGGDDAHGR